MAERTGKRVAVLGTGTMGERMARRILQGGARVTVWNRTRDKALALEQEGAVVAATPAAAVEGSEVVVTTLADAAAVEQVMAGEEPSALSAMPREAVWLQMSTVGPAATERLARLAGERGIGFIDAPVLGTRQPAERGELTVLASGDERLRDQVEAVLESVGKHTLWVGSAPGQASRLKLVLNAWVLGLNGLVAETMAVAARLGVEPRQFLELLRGGPYDVGYAHSKGALMMRRSYEPSFALRLALKDAGLILDAAGREDGARLRMLEGLVEHLAHAERSGLGDEDMAAVFEILSELR